MSFVVRILVEQYNETHHIHVIIVKFFDWNEKL